MDLKQPVTSPFDLKWRVKGKWNSMKKKNMLFVLGDSISMYYGPHLEKFIGPHFSYSRKDGNGGDSRTVLEYLTLLKKKNKLNFDYILLNCGLHDVKTDKKTGKKQIHISEYKSNLKKILQLLKKSRKQVIWVRTTHVADKIHNKNKRKMGFFRYNRDVIRYNKISDKIMTNNKISMIDLNSFTQKLGPKLFRDHVHFREEITTIQAAFLSGYLIRTIADYELTAKNPLTLPGARNSPKTFSHQCRGRRSWQ